MRRTLALLPILLPLAGILSCSDMPTAPHAVVTIEGSVRDRDGVAMMETYVYFTPEADPSGNFLPSTYVRTDTDGAFKTALAEGSYAVGIDPPNSTGYPEGRVGKFTVDRSKPRFDYRFSGTKVSGSLTGPGGPLLTRAYIQCSDAPYRTTASAVTTGGHYSLFIPPGLYTFAVQPSDNYSGLPRLYTQAQISSADTTIDWDLSGFTVTATVTLGSNPVAGTGVEAQSTTGAISASGRTGPDGVAVLYLPAGDYYYYSYPPAQNIAGPEQGSISISGDTSIPIAFPATRWNATLRRVSDNSPIQGAGVSALEIGATRGASATTDPFGKFFLMVKPSVGYSVRIYPNETGPFVLPYVSSTVDSTFDIVISTP